MKKLLVIGLLGLSVWGGEVKFAWDASVPVVFTNTIVTNSVTNYEVVTVFATNYLFYGHTNYLTEENKNNSLVKLNVGTNLTATIEDTPLAGRWFFAVTAIGNNGLESELSNVLTVEVPAPPRNMRTVILQYSGTLSNFYDVGFFRLRLP